MIFRVLCYIVAIIMISSCSSAKQLANPASSNLYATAATIPVFANSATTTKLYIYNDSDNDAENIHYNVSGNQLDRNNQLQLGNNCQSIKAHNWCGLRITTPLLNNSESQGSSLITASYNDNQLASWNINYRIVTLKNQGIQFAESTINYAAHGTVYAYNSTSSKQTISGLSSRGVDVIDSDPPLSTGSEIAGRAVIALAIAAQESSATRSITLTSENSRRVGNVSNLVIEPRTSGAILTAGLAPTYNTNGASVSGSVTVSNLGSATASSISLSSSSGKLVLGSNTCGTSLASSSNCTINFTITDSAQTGSANISVTYSGGLGSSSPLTIPVCWYNLYQIPLLSVNAPYALINTNESMHVMMVVTNVGSYNVSALNASYTSVNGYTTVTAFSTSCTGGQTATLLANSGNSCTIIFNAQQTTALPDKIKVIFSGSYGSSQTYSRALMISILNGVITTSSTGIATTVGVAGTATVTITNNTGSGMTFSNESVVQVYSDDSNVTVTTANPAITCSGTGNTLPPGGTCTYTVGGSLSVVGNSAIYSRVNATDASGNAYQFTAHTNISTTMYVYISNWGAGAASGANLIYCKVNSDGSFDNSSCLYANGGLTTTWTNPIQMSMYKGYIYSGNTGNSTNPLITCSVVNGVTPTGCTPGTSSSIAAAWGGYPIVISAQGSGNYVYATQWYTQNVGPGIVQCQNNPTSTPYTLTGCTSGLGSSSNHSAITMAIGTTGNSAGYLVYPSNDGTFFINKLNVDGSFGATTDTAQFTCPSSANLYGFDFSPSGNNVYLICATAPSTVYSCPFTSSGTINTASCTLILTATSGVVSWWDSMRVSGGYLYLIDYGTANVTGSGSGIGVWQIQPVGTSAIETVGTFVGYQKANNMLINPHGLMFRNGASLN